jgi:trans-2,3-dihydro-3-hydroxyanthranilate isomerase
MRPTFTIVDVFAEEKYAGNQLAVIRGAANLSDETLQAITREMNYSETTFILSEIERDGGYDIRIFTPGGEIPFAGHPTLGTAYVIQHEILVEPVERLVLNLEAGQIPVTFGDVLWMRQLPPTFGPELDPNQLARVLHLEEGDLDDRHPIQEVSTGLPAIVIPLRDLAALRRCRVDWELYRETAAVGKNPEDPATGSAAGCLAGYLVEHRYFGKNPNLAEVRVEQGYEIQRPSLLYLRAERGEDGIHVSVGGKVQMVARGELV